MAIQQRKERAVNGRHWHPYLAVTFFCALFLQEQAQAELDWEIVEIFIDDSPPNLSDAPPNEQPTDPEETFPGTGEVIVEEQTDGQAPDLDTASGGGGGGGAGVAVGFLALGGLFGALGSTGSTAPGGPAVNMPPAFSSNPLSYSFGDNTFFQTTHVGGGQTGALLTDAGAFDPEGTMVSFVSFDSSAIQYGALAENPSGEFEYTFDEEAAGGLPQDVSLTETFTVTVTDEDGLTSDLSVILTIEGVDDPIQVTIPNDAFTMLEGGSVDIPVTIFDPDRDGLLDQTFTQDAHSGVIGTIDVLINAPMPSVIDSIHFDAISYEALGAGETTITGMSILLVSDDGRSATTLHFTITVEGLNQAPVFDAPFPDQTYPGPDEDQTNPPPLIDVGTDILGAASASDIDGDTLGIVMTEIMELDGMMGDWQYRLNDSSPWQNVDMSGLLSDSNALHLDADADLRYLPDTFNGGTSTFSFHLWDQSDGYSSGQVADTLGFGDMFGNSAGLGTVSVSIEELPDLPVFDWDDTAPGLDGFIDTSDLSLVDIGQNVDFFSDGPVSVPTEYSLTFSLTYTLDGSAESLTLDTGLVPSALIPSLLGSSIVITGVSGIADLIQPADLVPMLQSLEYTNTATNPSGEGRIITTSLSVNGAITSPTFEIGESDTICVTTTEDIVNASDGVISLREAIDIANNNSFINTVCLEDNTTYTVEGDSSFSISDDMVLLGGPGTSVNTIGTLPYTAFTVGADLIVDGIDLTGASSSDISMFEVNSGHSLTLQDSSISSLVTFSGNGNAIHANTGSFIIINNSDISNNTYFNTTGGGIITLDSNVSLSITDSLFDNNASSGSSINGVVIHADSGADIDIVNSTFSSNLGNGDSEGGVIQFNGATLDISGSTFSNNLAGDGGALYQTAGIVTIIDSTFTNNNGRLGGAIYTEATLDIQGSVFSDNTAINGGAIFGAGSNADISIDGLISGPDLIKGTVFDSNSVTGTAAQGGALYLFDGLLSIQNALFLNNASLAPDTTGGAGGGAIYLLNTAAPTDISSTAFIGNEALSSSGAVLIALSAAVNLDNNYYESNTAQKMIIQVENSPTTSSITDSVFNLNNTTGSSLGFILSTNSPLTVSGNTFVDNTTNSGALFEINFPTSDPLPFNFFNNTVTGNMSTGDSAWLTVFRPNEDNAVLIADNTIVGNTATQDVYAINVFTIAPTPTTVTNNIIADNINLPGGIDPNGINGAFTGTNLISSPDLMPLDDFGTYAILYQLAADGSVIPVPLAIEVLMPNPLSPAVSLGASTQDFDQLNNPRDHITDEFGSVEVGPVAVADGPDSVVTHLGSLDVNEIRVLEPSANPPLVEAHFYTGVNPGDTFDFTEPFTVLSDHVTFVEQTINWVRFDYESGPENDTQFYLDVGTLVTPITNMDDLQTYLDDGGLGGFT